MDTAGAHRATLIGLCAVLCWSSTVGLIRSVSEALGPLGGAASLFSVSAALLLLVRGVPRWAQLRAVSPRYLWGGGALFVAYEMCLSVAIGLAQDRAQSLELGMVNYLWPCLTIVLAVAWRQQRARWWLWPGVVLCLWGLLRVVGGGDAAGAAGAGGTPWWHVLWVHMRGNPLAYGLAVAAALLWPAYSLVARLHGGGFNGVGLFVLATALLLWVQWWCLGGPVMRWSWGVAAQVLALGVATALGYSCWEYGIQRGHLAVMAAGSYFTPVLSALWASLWLAVQPGWPFWQGAALVTAGSLVCWWATRR